DACNNLSNVLQACGRFEEAEAFSRRAIELGPQNAIAHNTLGNALIRQGRVAEAIESYRAALEIQPAFANAASNLLLCLHYGSGGSGSVPTANAQEVRTEPNPPELLQEHVRLMRQCAAGITPARNHPNNRDPDR